MNLLDLFSSLPPLMFAVGVHGLGHLTAARLVGMRMHSMKRTPTGFRLIAAGGFVSYDAELYCALGGPAANAIAALLCRGILHLCPGAESVIAPLIPLSLYLGLFNLLPMEGFDGARVLHCWLCGCRRSVRPARAERLIRGLSCGLLLLFWLIALYLLLRRGSALSLYLFCFQLFRAATADEQLSKKREIGRIRENEQE